MCFHTHTWNGRFDVSVRVLTLLLVLLSGLLLSGFPFQIELLRERFWWGAAKRKRKKKQEKSHCIILSRVQNARRRQGWWWWWWWWRRRVRCASRRRLIESPANVIVGGGNKVGTLGDGEMLVDIYIYTYILHSYGEREASSRLRAYRLMQNASMHL